MVKRAQNHSPASASAERAHPGAILGHLGGILGHLWEHLGPSWGQDQVHGGRAGAPFSPYFYDIFCRFAKLEKKHHPADDAFFQVWNMCEKPCVFTLKIPPLQSFSAPPWAHPGPILGPHSCSTFLGLHIMLECLGICGI